VKIGNANGGDSSSSDSSSSDSSNNENTQLSTGLIVLIVAAVFIALGFTVVMMNKFGYCHREGDMKHHSISDVEEDQDTTVTKDSSRSTGYHAIAVGEHMIDDVEIAVEMTEVSNNNANNGGYAVLPVSCHGEMTVGSEE